MERKYWMDDGPAREAAWFVGLFLGVLVSIPVGVVLSAITGWWL